MLGRVKQIVGKVFNTTEHKKTQGKLRSPKWPKFRKQFLKGKACAACGKTDKLQLHHIHPFHLFPERELDETNVIPLCEGPGGSEPVG
jgi:5-methylcytosine-specific restriction endonuclease McrA